MIHSYQATGYPIVSQLNKCVKFKSIQGIKMTVFYTKNPKRHGFFYIYLVVTLYIRYWVYPEDFKSHCTGVKDWSPRWSFKQVHCKQ